MVIRTWDMEIPIYDFSFFLIQIFNLVIGVVHEGPIWPTDYLPRPPSGSACYSLLHQRKLKCLWWSPRPVRFSMFKFPPDVVVYSLRISFIAPVRGFWSWFGGVCSLTYCNGNFRVTMVSEPFNVIS